MPLRRTEQHYDGDTFGAPQDDWSGIAPQQTVIAPVDLLSAAKVRAVRFHTMKKGGYAYPQVETFIAQVAETLNYLESTVHALEVAVHEANEENNDLIERNRGLQATIEVFRVKGNPVEAPDGGYLTESQLAATQALQTENQALREQVAALSAQISTAQDEATRAWAAEGELRTYIDETLGPWLQAAAAQGDQEPLANQDPDSQPPAPEAAPEVEEPTDEVTWDAYPDEAAAPDEPTYEPIQEPVAPVGFSTFDMPAQDQPTWDATPAGYEPQYGFESDEDDEDEGGPAQDVRARLLASAEAASMVGDEGFAPDAIQMYDDEEEDDEEDEDSRLARLYNSPEAQQMGLRPE